MSTIGIARKAARWLVIGVALFLVAGATLALAAPDTLSAALALDNRTGYDPLSEREQSQVNKFVLNDSAVTSRFEQSARRAVLLVERHPESKDTYARGVWDRRADVFIYDYNRDVLVQVIYNLTTEQVDSVDVMRDVQLPLTPAEVDQAIDIALADPDLFADLSAQFSDITGTRFSSRDDVNIKAFTFHADSLPSRDLGAAADCGSHRCAQLLIFTTDNFAFELLPIVDLSTQSLAFSVPFEGGAE